MKPCPADIRSSRATHQDYVLAHSQDAQSSVSLARRRHCVREVHIGRGRNVLLLIPASRPPQRHVFRGGDRFGYERGEASAAAAGAANNLAGGLESRIPGKTGRGRTRAVTLSVGPA
eukprot:scaffold1006_cov408-Prasinococcus_capsulatus_cf.AAC.14